MVARGAGEPTAKRAKADEAKEEEAPLVRRREELVRLLEKASAKGKVDARAKEELLNLCDDFEAKNEKLLRRLPPELWQKILDENVQQNDLLALAMTCRFFREKQKDLGKKLETNLGKKHFVDLRKRGKMAPHTLDWFRWVCDTFEILPGFVLPDERVKGAVYAAGRGRFEDYWSANRVKGAVYEGDLLNYAALQGSVEILRWLVEEKGYELNEDTGWLAGMGGSIEVLEYLRGNGYKFDEGACMGVAEGGHLEALKFLRSRTTSYWPCPWCGETTLEAAKGGHLEILKFCRGLLKGFPSRCPWNRPECSELASQNGHEHVAAWIDQQEDDMEFEFGE